jgi:tetratricopeptide (TPR) repeat protein
MLRKQKLTYFTPKNIPTQAWLMLALVVAIAILYLPLFKNLITNWDDDLYITNNPYIKSLSLDLLKNIFTSYYMGNYHPLTMLTMAIDFQLGGAAPWPYHLTSLILHLCNILLVYVLVKRLLCLHSDKNTSSAVVPFVTAFLFGIHTFQVESVAWMSEQKNLLYTFFFLWSLILYIKYLNNKTYKIYFLSLFMFVLSLLSKGMAVPLSLCVICLDYYAGRYLLSKKVILEKIPFLVLSALFGYLAILAQHSESAIRTENYFSWYNQVAIAGYGFIQYLIKLWFPYKLSAFYPYPANTGSFVPYIYYVCFGLVLTLLLVLIRFFRHNKAVLFGSLFFIANISIVIQLLPVGDAVMADRYMYIPSIGLFFIIAYYVDFFWQKNKATRIATLSLLVLYSLMLSCMTYQRIGVWKNSFTLWNDAVINYPNNNDRGYMNRCDMYYDMGNYSGALHDYKEMLKMAPKNGKICIGMGRVKRIMGDQEGAMKEYNKGIALRPCYEGYLNRGILYMDLKNYDAALADLDIALKFDSLRYEPYNNKGIIYYETGNYPLALKYYNKSIQLNPNDSKAYSGRGLTRQAMNDADGAMNDFDKAIALSPSFDWYLNRAVLKIGLGDLKSALSDLEKASQMDASRHEAYFNKGYIYLNLGDVQNALMEFDKAIDINTSIPEAYLYRAIAKYNLNDFSNAIDDLNASIALVANADAYYYLGLCYIQLGQKDDARNNLKQAQAMGHTNAKEVLMKNCR